MKTITEIEEQLDKAKELNGKYGGMTYEEGVVAALEWILGWTDDEPME